MRLVSITAPVTRSSSQPQLLDQPRLELETYSLSTAGNLSLGGGVAVPTISSTNTLTNKTLTSAVLNTGVSGTALQLLAST